MVTMEKRILHSNYPPLNRTLPEDTKETILRYLAQIASEVTSGKLDPARVNWRYIRNRISDVTYSFPK